MDVATLKSSYAFPWFDIDKLLANELLQSDP